MRLQSAHRAALTGVLALAVAALVAPGPLATAATAPASARPAAPAEPARPVKATARTLEMPTPRTAPSGAVPGVRGGASLQRLATTVPAVATVGVTWQTGPHDRVVRVSLRSLTGSSWSAWQSLELAPTPKGAPNPARRTGTDGITVTGAQQVEVALTTTDGSRVAAPRLTVVDPGRSAADSSARPTAVSGPSAGPGGAGSLLLSPADVPVLDTEPAYDGPQTVTPAVATQTAPSALPMAVTAPLPAGMPFINTRAAWGADESITSWPAWRMPYTKAIVVHHTAGSNTYTSAQVPGIIRGIHYFHAVTRGWGDIGYNVLVDKFGRAWQGRVGGPFAPNLGGHAAPNNEETLGISMLGNFEQVQPPAAAVAAVARVGAYQLSLSGIRAGSSVNVRDHDGIYHWFPAVTTHQQVAAYGNLPTGCPGRYMIAQMPTLRNQMAALQSGLIPGVHKLASPGAAMRSVEASASTYLPWEDVAWSNPGDVRNGSEALVVVSSHPGAGRDAILGASLARAWKAPLMVVDAATTTQHLNEIARLRPRRMFIVAPRTYLTDTVAAEMGAVAKRYYVTPVDRVSDPDPVVSARNVRRWWPAAARTVYLAESRQPQFWLGLPQMSSLTGSPILLTTGGALPAATTTTLKEMAPTAIRVAGPVSLYPDAFLARLRAAYPGATVTRVSNSTTPQGQNTLYAAESVRRAKAAHSYYARFDDAASAAAAQAAAGRTKGAVFLTSPTCIDREQAWWSGFVASQVRHGYSAYGYSGGAPFLRAC